jgi:hypothetical protein
MPTSSLFFNPTQTAAGLNAVNCAGGTGVLVAVGVLMGVLVGGTGVLVAVGVLMGVLVDVLVGGTDVLVGVSVGVLFGVAICVSVGVGVDAAGSHRVCGSVLVMVVLYFPPLFKNGILLLPSKFHPPQIIMSFPVHTAVCAFLQYGAPFSVVEVHESFAGLYLPPVFSR